MKKIMKSKTITEYDKVRKATEELHKQWLIETERMIFKIFTTAFPPKKAK